MPTSKGLIKRDTTYISLNMTREALIKAMRVHGLTATKVIKPIADALEATRLKEVEGDFFDTGLPDHTIRLKATAMAIELLGLKNPKTPPQNKDNNNEELNKALRNMDEVELQRAVFRKDPTPIKDKSIEKIPIKDKV